MNDIKDLIKSKRLYFDGGFGTLIQQTGLKPGESPELRNISHPQDVENIHYKYLCAGSNIITANTFGANSLKFSEHELDLIIKNAIGNVKNAISRTSNPEERFTALDIGPTGRLLKPLGDLDFEEAVSVFAKTIKLGEKYGADLIIIETMNDCYETKAAVIAAKENSSLPIFVTNAYDKNGKLMTGATPSAMVCMLEGLGVDALGVNCSYGPNEMMGVIEEIINLSSTPVIVSPNAGLPTVQDGKTVFDLSADIFSDQMVKIAKMGANILGGCCGTTPEYIEKTIQKTKNLDYNYPSEKNITMVSSYTTCVKFGIKPILIGERINPTGKPMLKQALRESDFEYILKEGINQQEANANILDVNVGLPEIDEKACLKTAVTKLQTVTDLPLQIDTSDFDAMEAALRCYNGKALINSVNGKQESMDAVFPLAKKYGGTIIALTLDERGIPQDAESRIKIAEKIIKEAEKYNISKKDIIVDPLAMTVSSDPASANVTLECIKKLKSLGIKTSLGVSNISFGLPKRSILNSTFFAIALNSGLNAAIMNPHSREMMDVYFSYCALTDNDNQFRDYINYCDDNKEEKIEVTKKQDISDSEQLKNAITKGLKDDAVNYTKKLLNSTKPLEIINNCIVPALDEIGLLFEKKKAFLPQLLISAETAKAAFEMIKSHFVEIGTNRSKKGKIIVATVKGDIHDIGKNIVKTLLENYDYDVIDLGKDVEPQKILDEAIQNDIKLVGLSALMTTTVPAMEETIKLIKKNLPSCKIVVGGAVLTKEYAEKINADKYSADAMETVRYAEEIFLR